MVTSRPDRPALFQRLVDFNVSLEDVGKKVGQFDAIILRLCRQVLPNAAFDGGGNEDLRSGRDVMETTNALAEVDFSWHAVILDWLVADWFSSYWRISVSVARRAEMSRIFVIGCSDSDQRYRQKPSCHHLLSRPKTSALGIR